MADTNLVYYGNYNPAKIIDLSVMETNTGKNTSWRYNISRLLGSTDIMNTGEKELTNSKGFFDSSFYNEGTDVNESVRLLLEDAIPDKALSTSNSMDYPIGSVIDGAVSTAKGAIKGILGAIGIKSEAATDTLLNVGNLAVNAWSSNKDEAGGTGFVFDPWIKNAPAWGGIGGTKPLTFDYTFKFRLGQYKLWNAKEEVVKPIANLVIPTMLRKVGSVRMFGPFPTPGALLARITNSDIGDDANFGENASESEINSKLEKLALRITKAVEDGYSDYLYTLQIGPLQYEWVSIIDSVVEWSPETDQHGYPIAGTAKLTFSVPIPPALKYGDSVPNAISMKFKSGS